MNVYKVGGAVRDSIMGIQATDVDWVVVGSTPSEMIAAGYTQVGADFPVFLHPETNEEYALARTERKHGTGYQGFVVDFNSAVTLEEDLIRRDLTMNAIALCSDGNLIDPYGGILDITNKVIRHVSPSFKEDPVRILRVARFAARYSDFTVAPETMALLCEMVQSGEVDHLVPERVWQEIVKGLMTNKPSRMFTVLRDCGALKVIFPELDALWGVPQTAVHHPEIDTGIHTMMVIDQAASIGASLAVRYTCLVHDLGKGVTPSDMLPKHHGHEGESDRLIDVSSARMKVPKALVHIAKLCAVEHTNIHRSGELNAKAVGRLLLRSNAYKKPEVFREVLIACECDARGRLGLENRDYPQHQALNAALSAALAVDAKAAAAKAIERGLINEQIAQFINGARVQALIAHFKSIK